MSTRLAIAAQGLGVAAIIAVVYFAFLAPEETSDPGGIEARNGAKDPAPRTSEPDAPSRRPPRAQPVAPPAVGAAVPSSGPSASAITAGEVPDTPAGAQYESTVARLRAEVGRAAP